jgi:hypothetical protein
VTPQTAPPTAMQTTANKPEQATRPMVVPLRPPSAARPVTIPRPLRPATGPAFETAVHAAARPAAFPTNPT